MINRSNNTSDFSRSIKISSIGTIFYSRTAVISFSCSLSNNSTYGCNTISCVPIYIPGIFTILYCKL